MKVWTLEEIDMLERSAFEAGEAVATERIIKLLEEQCERPLDPTWEHYRESCSCWQVALIKGEN